MSDIQKLAEQMNLRVRSYSGRGMMGKSCLGIVADTYMIFSLFYELGLKDLSFPDGYIKSDSLGNNTIYYFPDVPFEDEEDEFGDGFDDDDEEEGE